MRPDAVYEGARAELGERVVTAIGGDDVVAGLGTAVEADDQARVAVPHQEVDDRALARISKPQIDHYPSFVGAHRE